MWRPLGALLVVLGRMILVWDVTSLDTVVLSVWSSHGIHLGLSPEGCGTPLATAATTDGPRTPVRP